MIDIDYRIPLTRGDFTSEAAFRTYLEGVTRMVGIEFRYSLLSEKVLDSEIRTPSYSPKGSSKTARKRKA